jgi:transcriptional regulator GlxA family with amidase domain
VIDWLQQHSASARRYGAVCTGTFLMGAAGLLNDRAVTTHWYYAEELKTRFPSARVHADSIFVRDGALFTSAGVSACIDLALALIEEDHGRPLAVSVALHGSSMSTLPLRRSQATSSTKRLGRTAAICKAAIDCSRRSPSCATA